MQAQDPIIGKRIGGYRVTTFIAHGSYGPIYYAERSFPTNGRHFSTSSATKRLSPPMKMLSALILTSPTLTMAKAVLLERLGRLEEAQQAYEKGRGTRIQ